MDINELKKNMSLIDTLLEKTNYPIELDTERIKSAKYKLEKKFQKNIRGYLIFFIVFFILWLKGGEDQNIDLPYRIIISLFFFLASIWYLYLYNTLRKFDLYEDTPSKLLKKLSKFKLKVLNGQVISFLITVIILTLLVPQIYSHSLLGFWLCISTICLSLLYSVFFYIPRYKNIFNDLTSIKE